MPSTPLHKLQRTVVWLFGCFDIIYVWPSFLLLFLANVNSCSCSLYVVVRPSVVCLSVTFVHPTQPIEILYGQICWSCLVLKKVDVRYLISVMSFLLCLLFWFLPRCMQCRRGLAMRILSVCPSVCPSHPCIVTKR